MSKVGYALAASAAMCLAAGVAAAQMTTTSAPPPANTSVTSTGQGAPSAAAERAPSAQLSAAAPTVVGGPIPPGASVQYVHVASPPVPDTPENRAKYGAPMSHAGRHTKAAGD